MKICITGATGSVGQKLGQELVRQGHQILAISRDPKRASLQLPFPAEVIAGDLSQAPVRDPRLEGVDVIVHLMGENVGDGRWTEARKKRIYDSRITAAKNLLDSLPSKSSLKALVSASAIGIYASSEEATLDENALQGTDFLAQICKEWEAAALDFKAPRTVLLRLGVILSPEGGALSKMREPFKLHVAGVLGSGRQWMSWIHLTDAVRLFAKAVTDEKMSGVYNAVSPQPVTNQDFSKALAQALTGSSSLGPPAPAFALRLAMGDMAQVILNSQKVVPARIQKTDFQFQFPEVSLALADCCAFEHEGYSVLRAEQYLDLPRKQVFEFFSEARNLEKITPDFLNFKILNVSTESLQNGTLIDYTLKVHQVPVKWRTEISNWTPVVKFTDSQLKGPYREWIHTHTFEDLGPGTLMRDQVLYKLPLGLAGRLVAGALVRSDVEQIFSYRRKSVLEFLQIGKPLK